MSGNWGDLLEHKFCFSLSSYDWDTCILLLALWSEERHNIYTTIATELPS